MGEQYAVEYSTKQRHFHVSTLDDVAVHNLRTIHTNFAPGYLVIGVFDTHEAAHEFIRLLEEENEWENKMDSIYGKAVER